MPDERSDTMDISLFGTYVIMSKAYLNPLLIKPLGRSWRRRCVVRCQIFEQGNLINLLAFNFKFHTPIWLEVGICQGAY